MPVSLCWMTTGVETWSNIHEKHTFRASHLTGTSILSDYWLKNIFKRCRIFPITLFFSNGNPHTKSEALITDVKSFIDKGINVIIFPVFKSVTFSYALLNAFLYAPLLDKSITEIWGETRGMTCIRSGQPWPLKIKLTMK